MADLAFDDFNRANGGLGANWTTVTGLNAPQIRANVVEDSAVGGGSSNALYTAIAWPDNQYAYCTVVACTTSNTREVTLMLRWITAAITGYSITVSGPTGATAQITIRRFNAGASTLLADSGATLTVNAGDILKADIVGSTVTAYVNGISVLSVVDGTPISSGSAGLGLAAPPGGTTADAQLDDWGGGASGTPITGLGQKHMGFNYARPYL